MRDGRQVRGLLRDRHRELHGTALLLTGDRGAADALLADAVLRALRAGGGLTADAVRAEMARSTAAGRAPRGQVLDAGLTSDPDDDLAPLAEALDRLPLRTRAVAVLRLADDVPRAGVAAALQVDEGEVAAAEREALAVLVPAAGGPDMLPWRLDALAAVPPDATTADRVADGVLARRRRRRVTAALAVAALVAAVPVVRLAADRPAGPVAAPGTAAAGTLPEVLPERPPRLVEVLAAPPRGSLAGDDAFLAAARRVPWGTRDDPPPGDRTVVYATDTPAGRVALVVARTDRGLDGAWLLGPPGARAEELAAWVPPQVGRRRAAAVLVEGAGRSVVVVVAAPGDAVEISPRLLSEQSGALRRDWTPVRVEDGTAVVEVDGPAVGRSASVRVVRDGRVAGRPAVGVPGPAAPDGRLLRLEPVRPSTVDPDPELVTATATGVALPFGVDVGELSTQLLWSGELTRTGGIGRVVVLAARVPGNAHVIAARGQVGGVRGGLPVPCGTASFPAGLPPSVVTVATECEVLDGTVEDRTWLVVSSPTGAVDAEVLDADGEVLDVLALENGSGVGRTPDGAAQVRVLDRDGEVLDVVPVSPAPEAQFGDYGED